MTEGEKLEVTHRVTMCGWRKEKRHWRFVEDPTVLVPIIVGRTHN